MRLGNSLKPRFSAGPGKRNKNRRRASVAAAMVAAGRNIGMLKPSRMSYSTVVLEGSELGAAAAKSREEILKATAKLASDWTKTKISVDAVRGVVG